MIAVDTEALCDKRAKRETPPRDICKSEFESQSREAHRLKMLARVRRGKHAAKAMRDYWLSMPLEQRRAELNRRLGRKS